MDSANAAGRNSMDDRSGILFPLLLIAAVAVIAFSAVGIVTMLGWMPDALSRSGAATRQAATAAPIAMPEAIAACPECGRVESVQTDGVRVLMDDGTRRLFRRGAQPALSVGQKVRVTDHGIAAAG